MNKEERKDQILALIPSIEFEFDYKGTKNEKSGIYHYESNKYEVTIKTEKGSFSTQYTQGSAITEDPDLVGVLWCLIQDAQTIEYHDQEEFLIEFGYAESPELLRKGFKAFKGCQETNEKMIELGIADHFEELNEIFQDY